MFQMKTKLFCNTHIGIPSGRKKIFNATYPLFHFNCIYSSVSKCVFLNINDIQNDMKIDVKNIQNTQ